MVNATITSVRRCELLWSRNRWPISGRSPRIGILDIKSMSKIPILGDLPLIGHLFRDHSNSHRRTEVMVALTIHVLKYDERERPAHAAGPGRLSRLPPRFE